MSNITINSLPTAATIDGSADILPIYTSSLTATQGISRNTLLGITGSPVGNTDVQTLTSKTLTSPTISGPTFSGTLIGTYTIGGTPTFPSSVVTLTGSQILTNKTLTSPTISAPTITNATLSSNTITGFSASTTGSIYGISVASGIITTANSIAAGTVAQGGISGAQLASSAITLGYAQITSSFTTTTTGSDVDVTSVTVTVTVPAGGRYVRVTAFCPSLLKSGSAGDSLDFKIKESGTVLNWTRYNIAGSNYGLPGYCQYISSAVSVGSHTYKLSVQQATAGTITVTGAATQLTYIHVEAI